MITGTSTLTSSSHTYGGSASSVSLGRCVGVQGHRLPSVCANPGFLQMGHLQRDTVLPESRIVFCQGETVYISGPQPFGHQGPVSWKTVYPRTTGGGGGFRQ